MKRYALEEIEILYPVRGCWEELRSPSYTRVPNRSPTLDKNLASMGPGILSSIGIGVWREALEASPKNNSDHPHPPYLQKLCPKNMPYMGSVGI